MSDSTEQKDDTMLYRATRRVLQALVRLFISQGLSFTQLIELLKETYVKEVARDLERSGERCTYSRISIVSGVHRKDVKRLMEQTEENDYPALKKISLTARLLSIWSSNPAYQDKNGKPLALPRSSEDNNAISFENMVSSVITDVRPRVIFDEWLSRDLIRLDEQGMCHLNETAIYPNKDLNEKLHYFARNTADHIAACHYNLNRAQEKPSLPERSVFYSGMSSDSVNQLQKEATDWAQKSILAINAKALKLAEKDDANHAAEERFTFGMYFYREMETNDQNQ